MKVSEIYLIETAKMIEALVSAETTNETLIGECFALISKLSRSCWRGRNDARRALHAAIDLHRRSTRRIRLIQGGNWFISRPSRANLTLVVNNETIAKTA